VAATIGAPRLNARRELAQDRGDGRETFTISENGPQGGCHGGGAPVDESHPTRVRRRCAVRIDGIAGANAISDASKPSRRAPAPRPAGSLSPQQGGARLAPPAHGVGAACVIWAPVPSRRQEKWDIDADYVPQLRKLLAALEELTAAQAPFRLVDDEVGWREGVWGGGGGWRM